MEDEYWATTFVVVVVLTFARGIIVDNYERNINCIKCLKTKKKQMSASLIW